MTRAVDFGIELRSMRKALDDGRCRDAVEHLRDATSALFLYTGPGTLKMADKLDAHIMKLKRSSCVVPNRAGQRQAAQMRFRKRRAQRRRRAARSGKARHGVWANDPNHGWPVRMLIPKRYAWKGAKWIKKITFSDRDQKGFWEVRGYSNTALPWNNDRYG